MAMIARRAKELNPMAYFFADLMEGVREVSVHKVSEPISSWTDDKICQAIKASEYRVGMPRVLVFDDDVYNIEAAKEQLSDYNLVTTLKYEEAELLLEKVDFDYVLLDLLVPASSKTMSEKGLKFAGQEMPLTPILALLALSRGVKNIGILTDANHHNHPASAALDVFTRAFQAGNTKIRIENSGFVSKGIKQWGQLLSSFRE
jgi:CheY-like chemotaxis protein